MFSFAELFVSQQEKGGFLIDSLSLREGTGGARWHSCVSPVGLRRLFRVKGQKQKDDGLPVPQNDKQWTEGKEIEQQTNNSAGLSSMAKKTNRIFPKTSHHKLFTN